MKNIPLPKLPAPSLKALASIQIFSLNDLAKYSKEELLKLHGFGPKSIKIIQQEFQKTKLNFKEN